MIDGTEDERSKSPDSTEFEVVEKEECETPSLLEENEKKERIAEKKQEKEEDGSDTITLRKDEYESLLSRISELEIENRKLKEIEEEKAKDEEDWGGYNHDPTTGEQFRRDWMEAYILRGRILQKREDEEERRRKQQEDEGREKYYADQRNYYSRNNQWNYGRDQYADRNTSYGRYSSHYLGERYDSYNARESRREGFNDSYQNCRDDSYSNSRYAERYDEHHQSESQSFKRDDFSEYFNTQARLNQYNTRSYDNDEEW